MDQEKIGKFILSLRTEKNLSQYQLAEMIPISRQAVSKWERGQTIPDSSTLLKLSEIFDVTINELLEGKRIEKNTIQSLEKTTLSIVDESNKKSQKIKKYITMFIITVVTLLLIFLTYYFINSYNTIKVYTVSGTNGKIDIYDGLFITTKEKTYLKLGKIKRIDNIKNITLYYKINKQKRIIEEYIDIDEIILDDYSYDEKFKYKNLKYILNNSYLEITTSDNKKSIIKLKFTRDFVNNKFLFKKKNIDIKHNQTLPVSSTDNINIESVINIIKENGTFENETYSYRIKDTNYIFIYHENTNLIQLKNNDKYIWDYYSKKNIYMCNNLKASNEKCKNIIFKNINEYILNKG